MASKAIISMVFRKRKRHPIASGIMAACTISKHLTLHSAILLPMYNTG
jgi:hypothetical protein